ncbi:MAG: PilX N-terminal domain-containing pilus assembly protein [Thermodesulfobacteriota bacterium]
MHQYSNTPENGSTLIVTVLVLVILSILGTAALTLTNTELLIVRNMKLNSKAFYDAEAGIDFALANIANGLKSEEINVDDDLEGLDLTEFTNLNNARPEEFSFSYPEYVQIKYDDKFCFISQGIDPDHSGGKAEIETCFHVREIPHEAFRKGIVSGGNIFIDGGPTMDGSIHANGSVDQAGSGTINGDVTAGNTADVDSEVNGTIASGPDYEIEIPEVSNVDILSKETADETLEANSVIDQGVIDNIKENSESETPIIYVEGDVTIKKGDVEGTTIISEGTVYFKGESSWNEKDLNTSIIAMQDIEFDGSGDSYGLFWCNGSFTRKGSSLVHGSVVAGSSVFDSDVEISGKFEFKYIEDINENIPIPTYPTPVDISWAEI